MQTAEWTKGDFIISTDKTKIDFHTVHYFLSQSYWAEEIPADVVKRSIEHSLCFGIYHKEKMVGFARVISDYATFAYLADVFVVPAERGNGLSKWLMSIIVEYPQLQGLRRFMLATKDAHGLYAQFGFLPLHSPERWMVIHQPDIYKRNKKAP